MAHPMGEAKSGPPRVDFDRRLKLEFHGSEISSDGGLLPYRELDDRLGLSALAGDALLEVRRGKNTRHLLMRPFGRPSRQVRRYYFSFDYQAQSWDRSRRAVAEIEWHPGQLLPTVGFLVTNLKRPADQVAAFYNRRGTAEQWIKEGKHAIRWTRLSCQKFRANEVRLQLHALAYNLANFMRTLALPGRIAHWSLTTLREVLIKIGARMVRHGRYVIFQMAEVAVSRQMLGQILARIARLRAPPAPA